jgi:hypothetical protein
MEILANTRFEWFGGCGAINMHETVQALAPPFLNQSNLEILPLRKFIAACD